MRRLKTLPKDERGATAVEYSLILALIFLAMIVGVQTFGVALGDKWNYVATEVLTR